MQQSHGLIAIAELLVLNTREDSENPVVTGEAGGSMLIPVSAEIN